MLPLVARWLERNPNPSLASLAEGEIDPTEYGLQAGEPITMRTVARNLHAFCLEVGSDEDDGCLTWAESVRLAWSTAPKLDPVVGGVKGIGPALFAYLRMRVRRGRPQAGPSGRPWSSRARFRHPGGRAFSDGGGEGSVSGGGSDAARAGPVALGATRDLNPIRSTPPNCRLSPLTCSKAPTSGGHVQTRVIATAYGRPALETLRTVVTAAKSGDPMAPVTILVPNNIAGIVARRYLAAGLEGRGPGVAGLFVTTLPRLAEQLATTALHPRRPATSAITAAAWRRALAEDAGCFDVVKSHPATVRALTSAHRELRDLTDSGRDLIRDATTLTPDLLRLHESVVTRLSDGWYDATDVLNQASALAAEHPERLAEYGATILFLPQALTQAEAAFAAALASSGLTVIAGMTGVARADEEVRRTLRRLDLSEPTDTPKPPLASRVLHASDSDDEVRCIVREVTRTLADGTPAHRVAVLYGAAQPYARLLHEHLAAAGLTVNGPATRAVHERALARGFVSILELAELGLPRAATFTALAEAPARDLADGTVKVARWERVSRLAGITGGDDWGAKLDGYIDNQRRVIAEQEASPDPWLGVVERAQREIDSAAELAGFIDRLRERLYAGSTGPLME